MEFVADSALMIHTENTIGLYQALQPRKAELAFLDLHPAAKSLMIEFDPEVCEPLKLRQSLEDVLSTWPEVIPQERTVTIPVLYDGADLTWLAKEKNLTVADIMRLHSTAVYTVDFLGFQPGFAYLSGLPQELACARLSTPRLKVPAGSVAIAGQQAGIYPSNSPGGWRLLGRTDVSLFDPRRSPPALLQPGDRVRFQPTSSLSKNFEEPPMERTLLENASIKVVNGGFFTTLQDLGRPGFAHLGVSAGGAADPIAARTGNLLVSNFENACALEMVHGGGSFHFLQDSWIAVTGADCKVRIDKEPLAQWTSFPIRKGQILSVGAIENGLRSYLCVHGGIEAEPLLNSASTFTSAGWGGLNGRSLRDGDKLKIGSLNSSSAGYRRTSVSVRALYSKHHVLRVTRGPQWNRFSIEAQKSFFANTYQVTKDASRMGLRLKGVCLDCESIDSHELPSEGIANGAIQVPSDGQPMILFCEQRTTGGYPKIANVILADLFRLGQLRPGQEVQFLEVSFESAWKDNHDLQCLLRSAVHAF